MHTKLELPRRNLLLLLFNEYNDFTTDVKQWPLMSYRTSKKTGDYVASLIDRMSKKTDGADEAND